MKKPLRKRSRAKGFTLLEFVIAMALFLLISGVAFSLFNQQQNSAMILRDQAGLNLALRNAITQLQLDIANGGSGYYQGLNVPSWPVGVTIMNNVVSSGNSCYNQNGKLEFGYQCFDQLNIIASADPSTYPAAHATDSSGANGSANCSYTDQGVAYTQAATLNGVAQTLASTAAEFKRGDQVLFLTQPGSTVTTTLPSAQQMSTAVLTADGAVSGSAVKLTFTATNADGTNSLANDSLDITACDGNTSTCSATGKFTNKFCGNDWVIKLAPIQYLVCAGPGSPSVSNTNPAVCDQSTNSPDIQDPKLYRIQNGTPSLVMDQVIGLKIGAALYNTLGSSDTSIPSYEYQASGYCSDSTQVGSCPSGESLAYDFSTVRSVRISLIGRTTPNYNKAYTFKNTFNGQPYQIQGMTVEVNPRNMSMNDK